MRTVEVIFIVFLSFTVYIVSAAAEKLKNT